MTDDADHMPYGCGTFGPNDDYDPMNSRDYESWQEFAECPRTGWEWHEHPKAREIVARFNCLQSMYIAADYRWTLVNSARKAWEKSKLGKLQRCAERKWGAILDVAKSPDDAVAMFAKWYKKVASNLAKRTGAFPLIPLA